jgi:hypothetical protein
MHAVDNFDIFKRDEMGSYLWIGSAGDWKSVQLRAEKIASRLPGEYLIVDLITGDSQSIDTRSSPALRLLSHREHAH